MESSREVPIDPWDLVDDFLMAYEWYVAGGTEEPPSIDVVPEHLRPGAIDFTEFLDWKYSNGLGESRDRHANDPEYFRSKFRLIIGGDQGES